MKTMSQTRLSNVSPLLPPTKLPQPPKHLSPASKRWFRSVVSEFPMSDTDLRLLTLAAETYDAAEEAREVLAKEGSTYTDANGGIKAHPCTLILRDNRTLFARLVRDLHLDGPQPASARAPGRPPGTSSPIARRTK
jgi:P27 family predicted phage terminase small subunit